MGQGQGEKRNPTIAINVPRWNVSRSFPYQPHTNTISGPFLEMSLYDDYWASQNERKRGEEEKSLLPKD